LGVLDPSISIAFTSFWLVIYSQLNAPTLPPISISAKILVSFSPLLFKARFFSTIYVPPLSVDSLQFFSFAFTLPLNALTLLRITIFTFFAFKRLPK
jgi:hypothetical protein